MDVDIEDTFANRREIGQARFFPGLPGGNGEDLRITVGVATKLQPAVELAVMRQQDFGAGLVHHPR